MNYGTFGYEGRFEDLTVSFHIPFKFVVSVRGLKTHLSVYVAVELFLFGLRIKIVEF